jgi:hypothetical protein
MPTPTIAVPRMRRMFDTQGQLTVDDRRIRRTVDHQVQMDATERFARENPWVAIRGGWGVFKRFDNEADLNSWVARRQEESPAVYFKARYLPTPMHVCEPGGTGFPIVYPSPPPIDVARLAHH